MIRSIRNLVRAPFRARKEKKRRTSFTMYGALYRAAAHNFDIGSIIDVGASNGSWSMLANRLFPDRPVLAFEPLSEQREVLEQLKQNHPWFDYVQAVAGEQEGEVPFFVSDDLDGSGVSENGERVVPMVTIDLEVKRRRLNPPYMLKLDTHGFELPILKGAEVTLAECEVVIIEVYNFQLTDIALRFHEMCAFMEERGFRCFDLADPMLRAKDAALWQMDLFFARHDAAIFQSSKYR